MEGVDGTGAIGIGHQLVEVAAPRLLSIITCCGLECCQDGREEGGWRRGGPRLQHLLSLLLSLAALPYKTADQRAVFKSSHTAKE